MMMSARIHCYMYLATYTHALCTYTKAYICTHMHVHILYHNKYIWISRFSFAKEPYFWGINTDHSIFYLWALFAKEQSLFATNLDIFIFDFEVSFAKKIPY